MTALKRRPEVRPGTNHARWPVDEPQAGSRSQFPLIVEPDYALR